MNTTITKEQLFKFATTLKILYVEDNEDTRDIIDDLLEDIFGEVIVAINGEDGIAKFDNSIDLIITDINMPIINGIDMLKKIKQQNQMVSSIIISAHNDTSYFTETIALGVDGYLLKPITYDSLQTSLVSILEKIYLKKEILNHKKILEKKLDNQITQLQQKDKALIQQSKLAAIGEIIDIVAHQWKQPLNNISLKTNMLEQMHKEDEFVPFKEIQKCNQGVTRQVKHLITTIDEFRGFLRPNTNMNVCSTSSLYKSIELLLKGELIKNQIELTIEDSNYEIRANENELKHIFISLISNSKDAFNLNDIKKREIKIKTSQKDDKIIIDYIDNAGGIDESIIDTIFEPHTTTKEKIGGTGIGMYMVKMIVDKYNGKIDLKNENNGAFFRIEF